MGVMTLKIPDEQSWIFRTNYLQKRFRILQQKVTLETINVLNLVEGVLSLNSAHLKVVFRVVMHHVFGAETPKNEIAVVKKWNVRRSWNFQDLHIHQYQLPHKTRGKKNWRGCEVQISQVEMEWLFEK